jgi:protein involved in ribonucleotide reduction
MSETLESTIVDFGVIDAAAERLASDVRIVYFSSVTEGTKKFVDKVGYRAERIPLLPKDGFLKVDYKYVLIIPTYGGGSNTGAVPKQVIKFLNDEENRNKCVGVIGAGNLNFGEHYCLAARIISNKLKIPALYNFEIMGVPRDVMKVQDGLVNFWKNYVL